MDLEMASQLNKKYRKDLPSLLKKDPAESWRPTYDCRNELNRALSLQQNGDIQQAADLYQSILDKDPRHPDALHLLGMLMAQQGKDARAIELIRKAIQNFPQSEIFFNNLGNVLFHAGRYEEALNNYLQAIEINPRCFDAFNNTGTTAKRMGKPLEAIGYFQKALEIRPDSAEVYSDMGNVLAEMGRCEEAIQCYQEALKISPKFAKAYNNMGSILLTQDRYVDAIDFYCKAVEVDPHYAEAFNNIGAAITDLGKPDEAVKFFQKALEINPLSELFLFNLYDALKRTCDWKNLNTLNEKLDAHTRKAIDQGTRPIENPFINLARHDDSSLNLAVAKSWSMDISHRMSESKTNYIFEDRRKGQKKITLGYLSSNFRNHALGHLIAGLFERHDRSRFNIYAYSNGEDDGSEYRKRIKKSSDKFVDIRSRHHLEAAQSIYSDKVDILIDLMGYTRGGRIEIAALRPAPVQVRYMGMAGTTGSNFFDYLVCDQTVVPQEQARCYTEKLVYLPDCYQVNDYRQTLPIRPFTRAELGLPSEAFVFCSFNQAMKMDQVMFDEWMKILQRVPGSVLWLQAGSKAGEQHLLSEAASHNIAMERIVFGGKMDKPDHLARLRLADLVLDTRLVSGAATTSDALWAGVPVISLQGNHFSSRMSASILKAIGLNDLVTLSIKEYSELAIRLATHPSEFEAIRRRLSENKKIKPLFDSKLTTDNLENAYLEMWRLFVSNQPPRLIKVKQHQSNLSMPFNRTIQNTGATHHV
jgi:protein O-GlcNAc transferase